jgi:nucleobase:cation symporter-1, NCS1 family
VNYFLGGLGAVLGPLFGIMMADYFRVKRGKVDINSLYVDGPRSEYWYKGGWNPVALQAFVPSAAIAIFFALVSAVHDVAAFSWFIGAGLAAGIYLVLMNRKQAATTPEGIVPISA